MVGRILRPGDPRDIKAAQFEIEKDDVFHLKNLYEWMHDWLDERGWSDPDDGKDKFEHYYWEKRLQNDLREHRIWWRVVRNPAESDYFRWVMLINWRNLASKKVEIVQDGQKVKTWRGDLTLLIESWIQLDYKDQWKDHWLLKHFDKLYRERIWKKRMEKWKKELYKETYRFGDWLKQYLDMKAPFDKKEEFHPIGGVGPNPEPPRGNK